MSVCKYSPFGARMVEFCVNMVNRGVRKVFPVSSPSFV